MSKTLSASVKKQYRSIAHNLQPIVTIAGNGLTEGVIAELKRALNDHELIKIKLFITDRPSRKEAVTELCKQTGAQIVQEIGKVAVLFKENKNSNPKISNIR